MPPSGLNATPHTVVRVPGERAHPAACASLTSQRMTVLSREAEASVPPSGLNATLVTASVCPARARDPRGRVLGVPEDDGIVEGGGGERAAVGAERHARHGAPCARRGAHPAACRVSTSQRITVLSSEAEASVPAVGAERHAPHGVRMPAQELTQLRVGIQGREEAAVCLAGVFWCGQALEA